MATLKQAVIDHGADLGVGIDGDGDRIAAVDASGTYHHTDILTDVLAQDLLTRQPGATILCDVKSSSVVLDDIARHGGKAELMRTGRSFFNARMRDDQAVWLGGETAGHIFIRENWFGFDDAILVAGRLLQAMETQQKAFADFLIDTPKMITTPEIKLACADSAKFEVVDALTKSFQQDYPTLAIDGARVQFENGAWGLVRASNTTPYLTLRFEAKTQKELDHVMNVFDIQLQKHQAITDRLLTK
jgi:phosphomannomutase/phosphoglucomutase